MHTETVLIILAMLALSIIQTGHTYYVSGLEERAEQPCVCSEIEQDALWVPSPDSIDARKADEVCEEPSSQRVRRKDRTRHRRESRRAPPPPEETE